MNKALTTTQAFERALGEILARVSVSAQLGGAGKSARTHATSSPMSVAVAYSGGLDSAVLLALVVAYARSRSLIVHAFHVHHGISVNADAWVAHCEQFCDQLGVPLQVRRVVLDSNGRGIEEAARIARYAALGEMAAISKIDLLLSAHHQDDQAETVLLQLLRGAGMPGLSGMPVLQVRPDLMGCTIPMARPLLGISRTELETLARKSGLKHVEDESNTELRYRRNALRHAVLPALGNQFPGWREAIGRTARHAQAAQSLLDDLARIDLQSCGTRSADPADKPLGLSRETMPALALNGLRQLSGERCSNLLRFWLASQQVRLPAALRMEQICRQMLDAAPDQHPFFDLGVVTLRRISGRLVLLPRSGDVPIDRIDLRWQGEAVIELPQWHGRLRFSPSLGAAIAEDKLRASLLSLGPREGRERLKLAPDRPSRSLKNLYQESAIPAWRRPWLPLLQMDGELLMAAGLGLDVRHLQPGAGISVTWEADSAPDPAKLGSVGKGLA